MLICEQFFLKRKPQNDCYYGCYITFLFNFDMTWYMCCECCIIILDNKHNRSTAVYLLHGPVKRIHWSRRRSICRIYCPDWRRR